MKDINNFHGTGIYVCELNVVSQKLIPYSFVPQSFYSTFDKLSSHQWD